MDNTNSSITPFRMPLSSPTGSGYNSEWNIKLKGGWIYHTIDIVTNLVHRATLKKATIDLGGTPLATASGKLLEMMNRALTKSEAAGRIHLDLAKFECRSPRGIYQTSLLTSLYDDVTLKLEFGARNEADPDNKDPAVLSVRGSAYTSENPFAQLIGGGRKYVPMMHELVQYSASAGKHDWIFPNGSSNKSLQRLILDESEVSISKVIVKRGTKTIGEMERSDIESDLVRYGKYTLQPGYLIIDFIVCGFGFNDALTTDGLNFEFQTDGVGAIKTVVDGFEKATA